MRALKAGGCDFYLRAPPPRAAWELIRSGWAVRGGGHSIVARGDDWRSVGGERVFDSAAGGSVPLTDGRYAAVSGAEPKDGRRAPAVPLLYGRNSPNICPEYGDSPRLTRLALQTWAR